jgi:HlyD family secretion protein
MLEGVGTITPTTGVQDELHKLRIDEAHRARRDERPVWPWVIVVLVLLLVGGGAWQWRVAAAAPMVQTLRVRPIEGATATPADATVLSASGYVVAAHKIELASKVVGRVAWVGVEMGDKIAREQPLVRLEDDEYKARVSQDQGRLDNARALLAELEAGTRAEEVAVAQAKLDQAKAELGIAQLSLDRLKAFGNTGAVSQQQVDDAESLVQTRKAQVESQRQQFELSRAGPRKEQIDAQRATVRQLEGALQMAMLDLGNTVIRSPVAATVLQRNVEVGEFVTTGFVGDRGAKGYVLSIADLTDLRVDLDVSQNDFAKVVAHQPCRIVTDAYPDRKYDGVVDLISPEANRQKATVQVRVKVLNPDDLLKPDMNATVSFLATQTPATTQGASAEPSKPVFRVPATAVREGAVLVVEDGKAIRRAVVGQPIGNGNVIEIRSGLIGGEDLIVTPPESLQGGARVNVSDR